MKKKKLKLAIIGLGYVGLPLAIEFSKKKSVVCFDVDKTRVRDLKAGKDKNLEIDKKQLKYLKKLKLTSNKKDIKSANCFIITVPTPINKYKKPDLKPLFQATKLVGQNIKPNDIVIYESTVYPGCIEEFCVPILEKFSKLKFNLDFFCGYSPERINPGDKRHQLTSIKKVTSGSNPEIANIVDNLYKEIITIGTHKAPSIKVAEAAKVIENTQRDLNIALINELSIVFNKLNIDTQDVLEAAETKWNFIKFKPGLVGGHCIGVDPYYLTYKAESVGYKPRVILAGRKINSEMSSYVVFRMIREMKNKEIKINKSKILIMGLTFKENCSDTRNSGVKKVFDKLKKYNCNVDLYDPWANNNDINRLYGVIPKKKLDHKEYDGIIICVAHDIFKVMGETKIKSYCKPKNVIFDLKNLYPKDVFNLHL